MRKIIISADSPCDLSPELRDAYGIKIFPFHIIFRGKDYIDNETITPADIFEGYREDKSLPQTAAVNETEYLKHFKRFADDGFETIHISLASSLSCAYENACSAADLVGHTHVIDSHNLSAALGYLAVYASRMAMQGASVRKIVKTVSNLRERLHVSFVMSTFEFLAAGGRCPAAVAHVGNLIKLRPKILVDNKSGNMSIGKLYRGKLQRVLPQYVEDEISRFKNLVCEDLFISSADMDPGFVELLRQEIAKRLKVRRFHISETSCCISSHCGPGTIGFLLVTEKPC